MSATGRSARLGGALDVYPTPAWCVHRLLEAWQPLGGWLAEPCVGEGHIVRAVNGALGARKWISFEVREIPNLPSDSDDLVTSRGIDAKWIHKNCDFLEFQFDKPSHPYIRHVSAVITNPPYSLAERFIRKCREVFPYTEIAMLLRIGFLASEDRQPLYAEFGIPNVYVLPNRPCFVDGRSDSSEYAWFVWPRKPVRLGELHILKTTPIAVRKQRTK